MFSIAAEGTPLSTNDVSAILNWLCPRCGGRLGEPAREFKCQGQCGKDWRSDSENFQSTREAARGANGAASDESLAQSTDPGSQLSDQVPFMGSGIESRSSIFTTRGRAEPLLYASVRKSVGLRHEPEYSRGR
jgi:hypothetical protein